MNANNRITIKKFKNKFGFANALSIFAAAVPDVAKSMSRDQFFKYIRENNPVIEIPEEDALELMQEVNRQIKSPDCPNNRKNKFYDMKHRYILAMLKEGRVDRVLESETLYHFFIGKYDFHQLKTMYKDVKADGTEVYEKVEHSDSYSEDDYRKCLIKMVYEMSVIKRKKLKETKKVRK